MGHIDIPGFIRAGTVESKHKILNALDIPNTSGIHSCGTNPLGTSTNSWLATQTTPPPSLQWFLAATEGAFSDWHVDSDGLATRIKVVTGSKLWILGRLKNAFPDEIRAFSEIEAETMNDDILDLVPIYLRPGMIL